MKWIALTFALAGSLAYAAEPAATGSSSGASAAGFSGKVIETTNTAGYTYVRVDTGTRKLWAAAPACEVQVGNSVTIGETMPMPNYHSKTLNRDFDVVYFTGAIQVDGAGPAPGSQSAVLPKNHPPIGHPPVAGAAPAKFDLSGIRKPEGGKTIAEIFAGQAKLKGQPLKVRGKVVKYNAQILGKNWLHLRDGTGVEGSNDLVLTTTSEVKLGDTVLVTGEISLNRDFGFGYKYAVMIEDATVVVER